VILEPKMKPSDELRYDHDVLRAKLSVLEEHLPSGHEGVFTLSRLTDSLASCLRSHTEREECLLATLAWQHGEPPGESLQHLHDEHENQRARLAILHELLTQPEPASDEQVATQALYLVRDLREHMAQEEERCFPFIDQERHGVEERVAAAVDDEATQFLGLA
jgi:hemerythrin-like domain-containing protein